MDAGDRSAVEKFFAELSPEAAGYFNAGGGNERRVLEFFENGKPDHRFFLTVDPAEPRRAACLCFYWEAGSLVPWMGIAVAEGYRGRHVGSFTLDALLARIRSEGCGGVLLRTAQSNIAAQRLYESRGFERLGEHPSGEYLYIKRFTKEMG